MNSALCSTIKTAFPALRTTSSASNTVSTAVGERPRLGSSSKIMSGFAIKLLAMASCCCCPPESKPAFRPWNSSKIGKSVNTSAKASGIPVFSRRPTSPSFKLLSTLSSEKICRPSGTNATPCRTTFSGGNPATSIPLIRTVPVRAVAPMIPSNVEDLPAPLGPISPIASPALTSRSTPRTAGTP